MKRTVTALCFAAAFGFATLGAQTTTTPQRSTTDDKSMHEVTITGCLAKDASGSFVLNNAHVDNNMASTTTGAGATTTAGTTGATTTGSPTSTTNPRGSNMSNAPAMTWMLMGGNDLDKHVGHKVQVTGKTNWDSSMSHPGTSSTASAAGAGTTAATPNPTTTAGAAGTTGTTGSLEEEQRYKDRDRGKTMEHPHLDVQSVKMISTSCS